MNEHTESFRGEASEITSRLLDRERIDAPDAPDIEVREGLYIGDVEEEARQFTQDAEFLRRHKLPFPAIQAEGNRNVPIALLNYAPARFIPLAAAILCPSLFRGSPLLLRAGVGADPGGRKNHRRRGCGCGECQGRHGGIPRDAHRIRCRIFWRALAPAPTCRRCPSRCLRYFEDGVGRG